MEEKENYAHEITQKINNLIPKIKYGTLRFYGEWFGRPMDNFHQITKAESKENLLIVHFSKKEILSIISPEEFKISEKEFIIKKSKGLIWQWYYYGFEVIEKNLMTYNYYVNNNKNTLVIMPEKNVTNKMANENEIAFEIC
jgi:hypothetical protein